MRCLLRRAIMHHTRTFLPRARQNSYAIGAGRESAWEPAKSFAGGLENLYSFRVLARDGLTCGTACGNAPTEAVPRLYCPAGQTLPDISWRRSALFVLRYKDRLRPAGSGHAPGPLVFWVQPGCGIPWPMDQTRVIRQWTARVNLKLRQTGLATARFPDSIGKAAIFKE